MSVSLADAGRLQLEAGALSRRLFACDATLWVENPGTPECADRLGWLDAPQRYAEAMAGVERFAAEVRSAGFDRVLLLGMGGSSLAPEVFARTFGHGGGAPRLEVLDTTHPDQVLAALEHGDLARTLFVAASKSGSTIETRALGALCRERAGRRGAQFVAITDPGSGLARQCAEEGWRRCFENDPRIGGRFSALSLFGLVPAALTGAPVAEVVGRAAELARASAAAAARGDAAGVAGADLAAWLAAASREGRDKLTLMTSPGYGSFGVWMEQLVAESTGKLGRGIVPVVDEPLVAREPGADRVWVGMIERGRALDLPPGAGAHTITGLVPEDLGREFYRWEVATALVGAWLGVNPFDQPNVAESKKNSEHELARLVNGATPERAQGLGGLEPALAAWAAALAPGDYAAILAYVPSTRAHDALLARMRAAILRATGVATTAGYGPRFLHSTGQLHKGGPATGAFLQVETEPARDVAVPGAGYTLGQLVLAQASGDWRSLAGRGRRVLRVRVAADELPRVTEALERALG